MSSNTQTHIKDDVIPSSKPTWRCHHVCVCLFIYIILFSKLEFGRTYRIRFTVLLLLLAAKNGIHCSFGNEINRVVVV